MSRTISIRKLLCPGTSSTSLAAVGCPIAEKDDATGDTEVAIHNGCNYIILICCDKVVLYRDINFEISLYRWMFDAIQMRPNSFS